MECCNKHVLAIPIQFPSRRRLLSLFILGMTSPGFFSDLSYWVFCGILFLHLDPPMNFQRHAHIHSHHLQIYVYMYHSICNLPKAQQPISCPPPSRSMPIEFPDILSVVKLESSFCTTPHGCVVWGVGHLM